MLLAAILALGILGVATIAFRDGHGPENSAIAAGSQLKLSDIPFNGVRAYGYLKQLCDIGPRPSGSPGMATQQAFLTNYFQKLGGRVELQRFHMKHPHEETDVHMANIIVHWGEEKPERILLCAHYDTLPFPLRDEKNPQGRFVGANDNAAGVAVLMELGNDLANLPCKYGVDFVLFDAEEFVFNDRHDPYFIGSEFFAGEYAKQLPQNNQPRSSNPENAEATKSLELGKNNPPAYRYRWAILLDMIGDADLQIFQERGSARWPDTQPLVNEFWAIAAKLGVREFIAKPKYEINDDHIALHEIGRIPCIDVIDFDYPPWHTEGDVPSACSALSMAKVGWVLEEWLKTVK
jgi:glutaminyl-peptide cyclotransferase